jgi:Family of unknown function (DUF6463)
VSNEPPGNSSAAGRLRRAARLTGPLVLVVGVGHVFLAGLLFADQLGDIASSGLIAAVPFDARASEEGAALWFTVNGVLLIMLGQLARSHHLHAGRLPTSPGWLLVGLGLCGAVVAPVSGFWVYLALGTLWITDSRS